MNFSELSDEAKDRARNDYREADIHDEWWDHTYEDAVRMGELLGISIFNRGYRTVGGATLRQPDINFSGFCSQGDGACFVGAYKFVPEAVSKITAETNDETLIKLATELTALQIKRRLLGQGLLLADVKSGRSNYCHSHTMDIEVGLEDEGDDPGEIDDKPLADLIRSFADWIYNQLESEYDYLQSDEHVDERLADEDFDEDGDVI